MISPKHPRAAELARKVADIRAAVEQLPEDRRAAFTEALEYEARKEDPGADEAQEAR